MKSFDDFRRAAQDPTLQPFEKVGFDARHRKDKEQAIVPDLVSKLSFLRREGSLVLDIGCGCSRPVQDLASHCSKLNQTLILVDSGEMLAHIPDQSHIIKKPHQFPNDPAFLEDYAGRVDVIIIYSVLHAIHEFQSLFALLDRAVALLSPGGQLLIGDFANHSKKKRFLSSEAGRTFHRQWSGETSDPEIQWTEIYQSVDDSTVLQILLRYRLMGLETYLLPQNPDLPLHHTREDLLIQKW